MLCPSCWELQDPGIVYSFFQFEQIIPGILLNPRKVLISFAEIKFDWAIAGDVL